MEEKRVWPQPISQERKEWPMERTDKEQASRELVEWKQGGPVWQGMMGTVLELSPQGEAPRVRGQEEASCEGPTAEGSQELTL